MCGINGIVSANNDIRSKIKVMNKMLRHRGPDDEGYVMIDSNTGNYAQYSGPDTIEELRLTYPDIDYTNNKDFDVVFGHRRLSIIDLSKNGHGPMGSSDTKIWVTFNGEIYNYIELREELLKHGYAFHTETDTEVIINSYLNWGLDCLNRFNGMWAFSLWDSRISTLYLCRDRFGIKPLYYSHTKDAFGFSSEIKPMIYFNGRVPKINFEKIPFFIINGNRLNTEKTYINGISSLPASHYLEFKNNRIETKQYYEIPIQNTRNKTENQVGDEIISFLKDSIKLRFRSDVPVGTCLSGGFDSTSIVGISNELFSSKLSTFSAVWEEEECDESRYIDIVNKKYRCKPHKVYPSAIEFEKVFNQISYYQEIPTEGPGLYPQWFVMSEAKDKVKVLLDGQGGDEVFGGYFHTASYLRGMLKDRKYIRALREYKTYIKFVRENGFHSSASWLLPKQYNFLSRSKLSGKFNIINRQLLENADFSAMFEDVKPPTRFGNFFSNISSHFINTQTIPALLHYEDRNSMAHSIESRVPFLDYRLVELGVNMQSEYFTSGSTTRPLFRKVMKSYLPTEIINRKDKLGFPVPFSKWTRTILKDYVRDFLLNTNALLYDFADKDQVAKKLSEHFDGTKDFGWILWRLLSLESTLQMYKKGIFI